MRHFYVSVGTSFWLKQELCVYLCRESARRGVQEAGVRVVIGPCHKPLLHGA